MSQGLGSLLAFVGVVALIPVVLWLLKRTPLTGLGAQGPMRVVAVLPLAPNQRLMTVEVGQGDDRRWLVLGVSPAGIATLHTLPAQGDVGTPAATPASPFATLLTAMQRRDTKEPTREA